MAVDGMIQARQVKQAHAGELLDKRNVVGVGLGYKVSQGRSTGELSVVVSVTHKSDPSALSAGDVVPQAIGGVKTDVVETGRLRAFPVGPRDRWRPVVPPGASVGHHSVTAGTFGFLVRRGEALFLLSNNHVLADTNRGRPGDPILQPAPADGGRPEDQIAALDDYVPLDFGTASPDCGLAGLSADVLNFIAALLGSSHQLEPVKRTPGENRVDAALARPLSLDGVKNDILSIGKPVGTAEAVLGMEVQKMGRTSGYTTGVITQVESTVRIDYDGSTAVFTGQLMTRSMSKPGDSGSGVLDMERRAVGLLFAGSEKATVINPIDEVLSALDVELAL